MKKRKSISKPDSVSGWQYFDCPECGYMWSEKLKDCTNGERKSQCMNCLSPCMPTAYEAHPEWPSDINGNPFASN